MNAIELRQLNLLSNYQKLVCLYILYSYCESILQGGTYDEHSNDRVKDSSTCEAVPSVLGTLGMERERKCGKPDRHNLGNQNVAGTPKGSIDYVYAEGYAHRLERAGERYYQYDSNMLIKHDSAFLTCEQDGSFDGETVTYGHTVEQVADGVSGVDYGWGLATGDGGSGTGDTRYRRTYTWNERNMLIASSDDSYTTSYAYGSDGQRSNKYTSSSETIYFNKMWTLHTDSGNTYSGGQTAKNIYLGDTRIVTKLNSARNATLAEEMNKQYYYHSDHLGSASMISDCEGDEYQRLEYTPYGELWVEKTSNRGLEYLPYKFTGKEMDTETGLYYYGARYLDPKYSRWISTDPALGEYLTPDKNKNYGVFDHINLNLYHYGHNNPIKYTDPTGRDDLYYDEAGNYLRTETADTTNIYLSRNDSNTLVGSQSDFETMTAALYGEGTDNLDEMQAIGDVIMNRAEYMGTSAKTEIQADGQVDGFNVSSRATTTNGRASNENSKLNTARNAAVTTMLGTSRGKSNGAYFWDGADISTNEHFTEWGIHYTDPNHDIYGTGNSTVGPFQEHWSPSGANRGDPWNHKLDSTATYGGTIFWKKNPSYQDVTDRKAYP